MSGMFGQGTVAPQEQLKPPAQPVAGLTAGCGCEVCEKSLHAGAWMPAKQRRCKRWLGSQSSVLNCRSVSEGRSVDRCIGNHS